MPEALWRLLSRSTKITNLLEKLRSFPQQRTALSDESHRITYGQLDGLVRDESRWLAAAGERFALLARNGCGWVLTDLALHHAQRLNVPLPEYFTFEQLRHVIQDAAIDSIVTDHPRRVLDLWPSFMSVGVSERTGLWLLHRSVEAEERTSPVPDGTVKVTYTSGSTAQPKGVCLGRQAIERVAQSVAGVTAPSAITRHLSLLPLPTLLENVAGVYGALLSGACCTIPAATITGMSYREVDPARMLNVISQTQPESLILVPELLRLLVGAASSGWPVPVSLKFIAVGGAAVSAELLEAASELRLPVYQGYGLSECSSVVCLNTPQANRGGSVGRSLPHAQVRCDERGELFVRGALMNGYLGSATPGAPEELATGDLGMIDPDGFVYINGRVRNIFITSLGRNISPEWIERELACETTIRHALAYGEAKPFAVALIARSRPDTDHDSIARAVARANCRLPAYAQVRRWAVLPESPTFDNGLLTANGRLRRERVLARFGTLIDELYGPAHRQKATPLTHSPG